MGLTHSMTRSMHINNELGSMHINNESGSMLTNNETEFDNNVKKLLEDIKLGKDQNDKIKISLNFFEYNIKMIPKLNKYEYKKYIETVYDKCLEIEDGFEKGNYDNCYFKLGNELIKKIIQLKFICNDSLKK